MDWEKVAPSAYRVNPLFYSSTGNAYGVLGIKHAWGTKSLLVSWMETVSEGLSMTTPVG